MCVSQNAKHDEAWMILKQVHDTNWRAKGQLEKVFQVSTDMTNGNSTHILPETDCGSVN